MFTTIKRTIVKCIVGLILISVGSSLFIPRTQAYQEANSAPSSKIQTGSANGILFFSNYRDENSMFDADRTGYYTANIDGSEFALLASWAEIIEKTEGLLQLETISPDGSTVLYLSQRQGLEATDIIALDLATGTLTPYTTTDGNSANWHPVWSPDGSTVAYLSGDSLRNFASQVKLYNSGNSQTVFTMDTSQGYIVDMAWSADGTELAIMLLYGDPSEWTLGLTIMDSVGNVQNEIVLPEQIAPVHPVLRGNSVYLACGTDHFNQICRLDLNTLAVETVVHLDVIQPDVQEITAFDVTPDDQQIIVSFLNYVPDFSGYVPPDGQTFTYLVNLATEATLDLTGNTGETRRVIQFIGLTQTASPTSSTTRSTTTNISLQHAGACGAEVADAGNFWGLRADDGIYIYDFVTLPQPIQFIAGQFECGLSFTADGEQFAVSTGHDVQLYETQTGNLLGNFAEDSNSIRSFALSPSGAFLTTSGIGATFEPITQVWNISANTVTHSYEREDNGSIIYSASSLAFKPDGTQIAAMTEHGVYVWSLLTGNQVTRLPFGANPGTVQFSANGKYLMTVEVLNYQYTLWNTATWEMVMEGCSLNGKTSLSPDGQLLSRLVCATGGDSPKTVENISTETGQVVNTLDVGTDYPSSLAHSPNGTSLALGYPDGHFELWDMTTGTNITTSSAHSARLIEVVFSMDGAYQITIGADNQVLVWVPAG